MPESCSQRRQNLIIEYNWLLAWAKEADLMEKKSHENITRSLGASQLEIAAVLSAIRTILETISELYGRYEELRPDRINKEGGRERQTVGTDFFTEISTMVLTYNEKKEARRSLRSSARKLMDGVGSVLTYPRRIRWILMDEAAFDIAIKRLHELTSHLRGLTEDFRLKAIQGTVEMTFMEMVQSMETQKELLALVKAVSMLLAEPRVIRGQENIMSQNELQMLLGLAKLKELRITSKTGNPIPANRIQYRLEETFSTITMATYQDYFDDAGTSTSMSPGSHTRSVWIEWKQYESKDSLNQHEGQSESIRRKITLRTAQLAELLAYPKAADFRTPLCLGYFEEPENYRLGWVFAMPSKTTHPPKTLRSLLSNVACPSLTERFTLASKLASCLLYLHVVNWLHKAIRSENILFVYDGDVPPLSEPILSGFDLSRPDMDSARTLEMTDVDPERDIYRWPWNQTAFPDASRSRKTFDIYSLGIVLLEIAHWKPIEHIMGFSDVVGITTSQSLKIRSRLLETEPQLLAKILEIMGRKYYDAVKACIEGPEGFGLVDSDNQTDPLVGVTLQRMYTERVVHKLKSLDV